MATAALSAPEDAPAPEPVPQQPPVILGRDGRPIRAYELHRVQSELVMRPERFKVLVAGRRTGKSHAAVIWCLRHGQRARLNGIKGVIWIVYPTLRVAKTAWRKFMAITPRGWITKVDGTEQHPNAITMGSVTYEFNTAISGQTLVGEGLLALWVDEGGVVPGDVWAESLRPTLMDHTAPAIITGTPKGANWFYDLYQRGLDPSHPDYFTWSEGPMRGVSSYANADIGIPASEIDVLAADMSETLARQEIYAEFIAGSGYFRLRDASGNFRCLSTDKEAAAQGFLLDERGCSTRPTAAMGVDLARVQDFTVIVGMDGGGWVTYLERFRELEWPVQRERIMKAWDKLGRPTIVVDATGGSVGDPISQDLKYQGARTVPFQFTGASKLPLFEGLAMAFDESRVRLPDDRHPLSTIALGELSVFEAKLSQSGNIKLSAPTGQHDDICCALALAYKGAMRYGDAGITF